MQNEFALSVLEELAGAVEACTGVRPLPKQFHMTREGLLSLNTFVRSGAEEAAAALRENADRARVFGTPAFRSVTVRNGWLVLDPETGFCTELVRRAAALTGSTGTEYADHRLRMMTRKGGDACPDDPRVREALFRTLLAAARGRSTEEDDRCILTMTHGLRGMERLGLENSCGTLARALWMLRSQKNAE